MSDEPCTPLTERALDIAVERRAELALVRAAGEIDLCTAPMLAEALGRQRGPVVLDLTRVVFLSAAGVQAILDARLPSLRLVTPRSGRINRVLDLTGLTTCVPRFDTVGEATGGTVGS